jgi:hypothetical protein
LIYYRNIIDRFPLVPDFLAQRLAKANCRRAERLELQRAERPELQKVESLKLQRAERLGPQRMENQQLHSPGSQELPRAEIQEHSEAESLKLRKENVSLKPSKGELIATALRGVFGNLKKKGDSSLPELQKSHSRGRRRLSNASGFSGINDSLYGTPIYGPEEQNPTFTMIDRGSRSSNESFNSIELNPRSSLPHPPVKLPEGEWTNPLSFSCDICGTQCW